MMYLTAANTLKRIPFAKLLFALISGIIIQWYAQPGFNIILTACAGICVLLLCFYFLSETKKFSLNWLRGLLVLLLVVLAGMMLVEKQNIKNNPQWFGSVYKPGNLFLLTVEEPPVAKEKSLKAQVSINAVLVNNKWIATKGFAIIYFKKDTAALALQYGSQLLSAKTLQLVKNSGNPASLNYARFCLFQSITHQAFISGSDYITLKSTNKNVVYALLFNMRNGALKILQQNIHSPKALGIAEALLIGYRNDLDKDLVQAYSDTGVVHIIAISGMHIAIIYATLVWMFSFLKPSGIKKWIESITILLVIWMFTLIAGAAPSILRATVMVTCIIAGKLFNKNTTVLNTLAASAFILLVYNPFNLWDVGFQLSYAAVLSIVLFFRSVSGFIYIKNKSLRGLWQLAALSLSAQIFALPVVMYHFHQFPVMFIIGNLIAVPLSSFVLYGELLLFSLSWWQTVAGIIGWMIEKMLDFLNFFIQYLNQFRYSVAEGLSLSRWQFMLMFAIIICGCVWLIYKNKTALFAALSLMLLFFILRDVNIISSKHQQQLIVYNIPQHNAIDFVSGNDFLFSGDSVVITDVSLRNYNLKLSRIKKRISASKNVLIPSLNNAVLDFNGKKVLLLNRPIEHIDTTSNIKIDVIIITEKIKNSIQELSKQFNCKTFIASGKTPFYKCVQWKKDCEQLHLHFTSVVQDGAFTADAGSKF